MTPADQAEVTLCICDWWDSNPHHLPLLSVDAVLPEVDEEELVVDLLPPVAPPITPRTNKAIGITKRFFLNQGFGLSPVKGRSLDISIALAYESNNN